MRLTVEQVDLLFCEIEAGEEYDGFKIVEKTDWTDEGKYQYMDVIFEHAGKTWKVTIDRSGSYFSDYYYGYRESGNDCSADEVEKVEVVTHKWQTKKLASKVRCPDG